MLSTLCNYDMGAIHFTSFVILRCVNDFSLMRYLKLQLTVVKSICAISQADLGLCLALDGNYVSASIVMLFFPVNFNGCDAAYR